MYHFKRHVVCNAVTDCLLCDENHPKMIEQPGADPVCSVEYARTNPSVVRVFTTLDAAELAAKKRGPGWSTMPFPKFEGMINKAPFTPSTYRLTVPVSASTIVGATQTPKTTKTKPPFPDVKIETRVGDAVGETKVYISATINGDSFTNHTADFETVAMAEYSARWIGRWANYFVDKIKKDMGY